MTARRSGAAYIGVMTSCCHKHVKQAAVGVLVGGLVLFFVLMHDANGNSTDDGDIIHLSWLRGRLKSTGNYTIYHSNQTVPVTWESLEQLLPPGVTVSSFPPQFYKCLPTQILKQIGSYDDFDRFSGCGRVFYNRVPKCGSRTMVSVFRELSLQRNYTVHTYTRPNGRSFFRNIHQMVKFGMDFSQYEEPMLYSMHLHYVNFTQLGIPPPMYVNVIRDPVQRVISHFYYKKYGSGNEDGQLQHNMTLDECVADEEACPYLPIHQVLPYFCGHSKSCRVMTADTLQRAKRALRDSYLVVGLTEDLTSFLELLETFMPSFFRNATNVYNAIEDLLLNKTQTTYKPTVSPQTVGTLRDMLHLELEFYEYVKQRFYVLYKKVQSLKLDHDMGWNVRRRRKRASLRYDKPVHERHDDITQNRHDERYHKYRSASERRYDPSEATYS